MYSKITTEYFFHCEDDWLFCDFNFIEKSFNILNTNEKIIQVWLRDKNDTNGHPIESCNNKDYNLLCLDYLNAWNGFSFNPGLKRLKDYKLIESYEKIGHEPDLSIKYKELGYRAAILNKKYIEHIGWGRHINDIFEITKFDVLHKFSDIPKHNNFDKWFFEVFQNWENWTFECFKKVKNNKKIALDIGAFIGMTGIWLSNNFESLICVEADNESVVSLKNNLDSSNCKNYTILHNAFFNKNNETIIFGPNKFNKSELNESMSQIKLVKTNSLDYQIKTISLDKIIENINPLNIGIIKIDIEGGEEYIYKECINFCVKFKIPFLLSFHIDWWNKKIDNDINNILKKCVVFCDSEIDCVPNVYKLLNKNPFSTIFVKNYLD